MNEEDLLAKLREANVIRFEDVKAVILETTGGRFGAPYRPGLTATSQTIVQGKNLLRVYLVMVRKAYRFNVGRVSIISRSGSISWTTPKAMVHIISNLL